MGTTTHVMSIHLVTWLRCGIKFGPEVYTYLVSQHGYGAKTLDLIMDTHSDTSGIGLHGTYFAIILFEYPVTVGTVKVVL